MCFDSATISGVLSALYDVPPTLSWDDHLVTKLNEFDKIILYAGYPGSYLVEYLTWMKYLPSVISPWKRKANEIFNEYSTLFMSLFRDVESKVVSHFYFPYSLQYYLMHHGRTPAIKCLVWLLIAFDKESVWVWAISKLLGFLLLCMFFSCNLDNPWLSPHASSVQMAGWRCVNAAVTFLCMVCLIAYYQTAESMLWIFVAMLCFPKAQRKCQEELDAVVGRSKTPTLNDKESLPYMRATVRELLRWRAIAPIGKGVNSSFNTQCLSTWVIFRCSACQQEGEQLLIYTITYANELPRMIGIGAISYPKVPVAMDTFGRLSLRDLIDALTTRQDDESR